MIEQPVDEQDEVIEEAEDEEIIEASDDEYEEDATEYTDEVEAVEDDSEEMLYPVTINGKQERGPFQLQQSAAVRAIFRKKCVRMPTRPNRTKHSEYWSSSKTS